MKFIRMKSFLSIHFVTPAACIMQSHLPSVAAKSLNCFSSITGSERFSSKNCTRLSCRNTRLLFLRTAAQTLCPSVSPFSTMKLPMKPLAPVTNIFILLFVSSIPCCEDRQISCNNLAICLKTDASVELFSRRRVDRKSSRNRDGLTENFKIKLNRLCWY